MEAKKEKKQLAIGTFTAKTRSFNLVKFTSEKGERVLLAIEVEFTEGANVGLLGTMLLSAANSEFERSTLAACGWTEDVSPLQIKPGQPVKAVVDWDTNPKTNERKPALKFINPIDGRKSALVEKYGVSPAEQAAWTAQFKARSAALTKAGVAAPRAPAGAPPAAPPAAQSQVGHAPVEDDEIPF